MFLGGDDRLKNGLMKVTVLALATTLGLSATIGGTSVKAATWHKGTPKVFVGQKYRGPYIKSLRDIARHYEHVSATKTTYSVYGFQYAFKMTGTSYKYANKTYYIRGKSFGETTTVKIKRLSTKKIRILPAGTWQTMTRY